jgi:hypothetical protein
MARAGARADGWSPCSWARLRGQVVGPPLGAAHHCAQWRARRRRCTKAPRARAHAPTRPPTGRVGEDPDHVDAVALPVRAQPLLPVDLGRRLGDAGVGLGARAGARDRLRGRGVARRAAAVRAGWAGAPAALEPSAGGCARCVPVAVSLAAVCLRGRPSPPSPSRPAPATRLDLEQQLDPIEGRRARARGRARRAAGQEHAGPVPARGGPRLWGRRGAVRGPRQQQRRAPRAARRAGRLRRLAWRG